MKFRTLSTLIFATLCASGALAQNTASTTTAATGQAVNAGVTTSVNTYGAPQLPWTGASIDNNIHTNQAQTAPTVFGSTSSSAGGCPAVDGWSGGIAVINGGKSTAKELPGCMLNLLTDRIGALRVIPVKSTGLDGKEVEAQTFDGQSLMKLEAWCLYADYKTAIENSGLFKCKATRDEEARQRAVAIMQPAPVPTSTDPYKAIRGVN